MVVHVIYINLWKAIHSSVKGYCIVQNFGRENFGEFGKLNIICQYLPSQIPVKFLILIVNKNFGHHVLILAWHCSRFIQPMKKKADLPDSLAFIGVKPTHNK